MFPISVSQFTTYRWSFFQDVIQAAKRGYDGIGVWRKKAEDADWDEAISFIHEMEMAVSSVSWAGGFTGSDGRSHAAAIEDGLEAIDFARQLQAGCLIVHPGALNHHTDRHARRLLRNALAELVPAAADQGVRLAFEPRFGLASRPWTFLNCWDELLEIVSEHPIADLGLVLDLFHVGGRPALLESLPEFVNRVALVQLADLTRKASGEMHRAVPRAGELDLKEWLSSLARSGYRGFLELELHGFEVETIPYPELLDQAQTAANRMVQELGVPSRSRRGVEISRD